ncbi:MAG: hypothetical protein IJR78_00390, partial [Clostridia bacterium]|nr:hypothetical protein [Clostridia bacterium]
QEYITSPGKINGAAGIFCPIQHAPQEDLRGVLFIIFRIFFSRESVYSSHTSKPAIFASL